MRRAIEAVAKDEMGWLRASKEFNVPQATLRRHARNKNKSIRNGEKGLGRFRTSLTMDMEDDLAQHILSLENRLFGMSTVDVRKLAFELAEKNEIPHHRP